MPKQSAGILLYRYNQATLQIFLVHPGGPFYKNKDEGAWSIPKGEFFNEEDALEAAKREFFEETGSTISGSFKKLTAIQIKSGKNIHAWAIEGNIDEHKTTSNTFEMDWPPRSGKMMSFPEVDRTAWFDADIARVKISPGQIRLIEELEAIVM